MKTALLMKSRPGRMQGVSLLEVLVSVVILAIGLLGVAALQSIALRGGQSSLESSQAVIQTSSILESIRANRNNASSYNGSMLCTAPTVGSLVENDLNAWITSLKNTLGNTSATCGKIESCPDACKVTVQWDDSRGGTGGGGTNAAGSATRQVVTETRI